MSLRPFVVPTKGQLRQALLAENGLGTVFGGGHYLHDTHPMSVSLVLVSSYHVAVIVRFTHYLGLT